MIPLILLLIIVFAVMAYLLALYARRVANMAITDQFRAGETIVNDGRVPDKWVAQINRRLAGGAIRRSRHEVGGIELALDKLDRLYRFFENSPFYENAEAREQLLKQLQEVRGRWEEMTWDELV
jgi:hypothetical protein